MEVYLGAGPSEAENRFAQHYINLDVVVLTLSSLY